MHEYEPVISGIHCEVENCVYNNGCNYCTAERICVKNDSNRPERTFCETFSEI